MSGDIQGMLPSSWIWTALSEVTEPTIEQGSPEAEQEFLYIDISSIDNRVKKIVTPKSLPTSQAPSRAKQHLEPHDVLVSMTRPNLNAVAIVPDDLTCAIGSTGFHVLRTKSVDPAWLFYLVQTHAFIDAMSQVVQGALYPAVRPKDVNSYKMPLAPLAEQHRIIAEIEKHFTRLDASVSALKRIQANLKRYRASVLKAACEGRLILTEAELAKADGRDYEPADRLLSRILKERRANWEADQLAKMKAQGKTPKDDKWKEKYKEPSPSRTTNLPLIPNGWIWVSANQICTQITDGEHIQPRYQPTGYPMLTAKNVRSGHVDFRDIDYIAEQDFNNCLKRCAPQENDLLIVSVGATTGRAAIVGNVQPFALVRSVLMLRPLLSPRFLLCWIQSPWCQTWISRASGSSAQAHLYISDTKNIPVPFPPLSEQERIVAEVERHISIIEELETVVEANLRRAERLRQSILKSAFEGKLVPQDPTDEPASNLLERIRAEREKKLSKEKVQKNKRREGKSRQPELDWQAPEENIVSTKAQTNS